MTSSDPTFNLSALADRLFAERRLLPLAGKIQRARDLHSLTADLEMALESLDALKLQSERHEDPQDLSSAVTASALLNNALILYARATKTESDVRRGCDLRSRFTEAEKLVHKELCDLRDDAIAHFGAGGSYSGEWQAEVVILQFSGSAAKPGVATRRMALDRKLVARAREQIVVARALLRKLSLEHLEEVTDEINRVAIEDPEFHREIEQHPLNLDIFLGSQSAGEAARSSLEKRYEKGIAKHK